ncbi:MAG: LPS export ABC transporter periplasmic protein LptC [Rhodospirillales bacterium]|nr:LPS export ABC transporter periplasmic protein LptC [Rhodospirillales bacterium]
MRSPSAGTSSIPIAIQPGAGDVEGRAAGPGPFRRGGYSRFVAIAKLVLPLVAAALLALVWAWPSLRGTELRFRIGFSDLVTRETAGPSMINPRYVGTDKNQQPFAITSDVARHSSVDRMKIDLDVPKGDIALNDGTWLLLTAETGVYARTAKTLDLFGGVTLFHDSGYEIRTDSAYVDLEKGTAQGDQPVHGQGPFGDLRSEGFVLLDKGKIIHFTGKSKLVMYPGFRLNPS